MMKTPQRIHAAVISGLLVILTLPVSAQVSNGSFENGLQGWDSEGLAGTLGVVGAHSPTNGQFQGALEANQWDLPNGVGPGDVDEYYSELLGIWLATLVDPNGAGGNVDTSLFELYRRDSRGVYQRCASDHCYSGGSIIYQSIDVAFGQKLAFDWNLLGFDAGIPDAAWMVFAGAGPAGTIGYVELEVLADSGGNVVPVDQNISTPPFLLCNDVVVDGIVCPISPIRTGATGYQSFLYDVPFTGTATLGFVLLNAGDDDSTAGLLIDNVRLVDPVSIDISPFRDGNQIRPRSRLNVYLAILSTNSFDALQVLPESSTFGPNNSKALDSLAYDFDEDGDADLLLAFKIRDTGIECGDTEATLFARTADGGEIYGTDMIETVFCN